MDRRFCAIALISAAIAATPAHALCRYDGIDYAKTTIAQEFRNSKWVAKIEVVSERNNFKAVEKSDEAPWSLYELKVVETFKGAPPNLIRFFTYRNSGGYYFDRPWAGPDVGGDYLVFLNPTQSYKGQPLIEKGTVFVNYSCGQSKAWSEVSNQDLSDLQRLRSHK